MTSHGDVIDDFELDHVVMYVRDLDPQIALWRDRYGFREVAAAGSPAAGFRSVLMGQGNMRLVLTEATSEQHPAASYVLTHGDGVADIAFRTSDVRAAFAQVVGHGARVFAGPEQHDGGDVAVSAVVSGFGDVVHTLVERRDSGSGLLPGFRELPGTPTPEPADAGSRLHEMDHFAICLETGHLDWAAEFYQAAFGFSDIFEEHIVVGSQAMISKVVQSRTGQITFTMIQPDPAADPGQIDEFLKNHGGAGVQHIAFTTEDIARSVRVLSDRGVHFLTTPGAYYDRIGERLVPQKHSLDDLRELNILVDEDHGGQLFQLFTQSVHDRRTLFFELIERCGAETFGSSNIKALYEAVELERTAALGERG
ncbi:4-hydroxyphenylpyruvate dioxygenase [Micromonospora sp. NPDC092111]|uniref:4-hydroxyphenylpyruvate dioxygenase n=1 Tax=Micromonospora sp. NPDC092111 TaxID=3364289 RepID=UPI00380B5F95